jgi:ATP-dependent RNA helicase DeaD
MPEPIKDLAANILYKPEYISVIGDSETTNNIIEQRYFVINESQRDDAIVKLLETEDVNKCIIFCRMKREVDRLVEHLEALGFSAKGLHGDLEQDERELVVKAYRRGEIKIMVATDVAARGLDVKDVTHVFNYHIPFDPQSYVHRIGRTGRAGKSGIAITLVSTEEFKELQRIQKEVGADMQLCTIDSGAGLEDNDYELTKENIENIKIRDEAKFLIEKYSEDEKELLLEKMISFYLAKEPIISSGGIGYDEDAVNDMMDNYNYSQGSAPKRTNARKRR